MTSEAARMGFQGSRLHLELNRAAAIRLRDALDRAIQARADSAPVQRMSWVLPDGRALDVSVRLTDGRTDGEVDGRACGDVSGDFAAHAAACGVLAVATDSYLQMPRSPQEAAAHDQRRINDALDRHLPVRDGSRHIVRDDIRDRAVAVADATRPRRLADAARAVVR